MNIALPSIGRGLHISLANLSWVVNAYVLTFGGFLLLGGRIADLLGRRLIFMVGLGVFSAASLLGGAGSERAVADRRAARQAQPGPATSARAPTPKPEKRSTRGESHGQEQSQMSDASARR